MKKRYLIFVILIIVIVLTLTATRIKYLKDINHYHILNLNYLDSTKVLKNPDRGWYSILPCMVNDNSQEGNYYYDQLMQYSTDGDMLVLLLFNISNYRSGEISRAGLQYIENVFKDVKKSGMKAIVRFEYDWDGNGLLKEPDKFNTVLKHMEQVAPILNDNKDLVYLVQGVLVGSYGEMHDSKFLSEDQVKVLLNKFLELTDPSIQMSVRTPTYWRSFMKSSDPIRNFSQLPGARIGLYNDGLNSSDTDLGTYSDESDTNKAYNVKWLRQEELEFQSNLCQFVPNGGEVAALSSYNDTDRISKEFRLMHISYLDRGYNLDVLQKWKDTSVTTKSDKDPEQSMDGYQLVGNHMGYRLVLRETSVPDKIFLNGTAKLLVKIENTGYANPYHKYQVSVILRDKDTGAMAEYPVNTDVRLWRPKEVTQLDIKFPTGKLKEGSYDIFLQIRDRQGTAIELANEGIYNQVLQANKLGELQARKLTLLNIWNTR